MGAARWLSLGSLLSLVGLLQGRLVRQEEAGFGECDQFFYAGTPPAGLPADGHVKICQRAEGAERFATLYSIRDRIPVYSAFRAAPPAPGGAELRWLVEPQVSGWFSRPGAELASKGALQPPEGQGGEAQPPRVWALDQETRVSDPLPRAPGITAYLAPCQSRSKSLAIWEPSLSICQPLLKPQGREIPSGRWFSLHFGRRHLQCLIHFLNSGERETETRETIQISRKPGLAAQAFAQVIATVLWE